jgi:hypothetical protein
LLEELPDESEKKEGPYTVKKPRVSIESGGFPFMPQYDEWSRGWYRKMS